MVLLLERFKPPNSMISALFNPWSPVFMEVTIPTYFKTYKKQYGNILQTYYLYKCGDLTFWKIWKVRVPILQLWSLTLKKTWNFENEIWNLILWSFEKNRKWQFGNVKIEQNDVSFGKCRVLHFLKCCEDEDRKMMQIG